MLWDPDGSGPQPSWLVVGGYFLTGGDQPTVVPLLAHDGVQWRGLGFAAASTTDEVDALVVYNGDLIAAGRFTAQVSGGSAFSIARLSGSTWLSLGSGLGPSSGGHISALEVYAGDLYAGGGFTSIGGAVTGPVARWNGSFWSRLDTSTSAVPGGTVHTLATLGNLYVGGDFTFPRTGLSNGMTLGRWNGTSWVQAPIFPISPGTPEVTSLSAILGATQGTSFLFVGGSFPTLGGTLVQNVARAPYAVTSFSALGGGLPQLTDIRLLARTPFLGTPEVLATGRNANPAERVKLWTGTTWLPLGSLGLPGNFTGVTAPQYHGGYVVGLDDQLLSLRAPSMLRYISDWVPVWGSGLTHAVECLAVDGPDVIAGGTFLAADNSICNGIARRVGSTWTAMGSGVAGGGATVKAVARAANGIVFAGGDFTTAGGTAVSNIASWNGSSWSALGTGTNGPVLALLVAANGDLIAGGDFTTAGGVTRNRVARWNGTAWSPLAIGMDGAVRCLMALANGDIVAGGAFVLASGLACNHIARWNGLTWSPMTGGTDGDVHALALRSNGEVVAGGEFTTAGGNPAARLARLSGSSWLPLGAGVSGTVHALIGLPDGDVLAGGVFTGGSIDHLARWNAFNDSVGGVGSGLAGADVRAFAKASNDDVFLAGDFDEILPGLAAGNFAILTAPCAASVTPVATACVGPAGPVSLTADSLPWAGSTFRSTASGFAPGALGVSVLGFTPNNLPLSLVLPVALPNCNLLAATDAVLLTIPQAGTSHYQLTLPDTPVFTGVPLSHQFVQLAISTSGVITSLSSSNALTLVLGLY
ncbi:MAG: hypothetical protein U1E73_03585 [Planctomycetota bacterium]